MSSMYGKLLKRNVKSKGVVAKLAIEKLLKEGQYSEIRGWGDKIPMVGDLAKLT